MTPRETTITVRGDLRVTVDEWEGSAKATVRYKGNLCSRRLGGSECATAKRGASSASRLSC